MPFGIEAGGPILFYQQYQCHIMQLMAMIYPYTSLFIWKQIAKASQI